MRLDAWIGVLWLCALAGVVGCGKGETGSEGGAGNADLAMALGETGDLRGAAHDDMGLDTGDMALPPNALEANWNLITANIAGGANNGFAIDCDKAGVTQLKFTVVNTGSMAKATSMAACPAGNSNGVATLTLPDTKGPFVIFGVAVGKPKSAGDRVQNVMPMSNPPTLRIYVDGCDQPTCSM